MPRSPLFLWKYFAESLRAAYRGHGYSTPDYRSDSLGARCVRSLP